MKYLRNVTDTFLKSTPLNCLFNFLIIFLGSLLGSVVSSCFYVILSFNAWIYWCVLDSSVWVLWVTPSLQLSRLFIILSLSLCVDIRHVITSVFIYTFFTHLVCPVDLYLAAVLFRTVSFVLWFGGQSEQFIHSSGPFNQKLFSFSTCLWPLFDKGT